MDPIVFKRAAPATNAAPADMPSFARNAGLTADGSDKIFGNDEAIDLAKGVVTGNPFESDALILDTESRVDPAVFNIERFMAEELEVVLHDPSNETEPEFVELTVNGHHVCAKRDSQHPVKMRRYHVAVLAQAKSSRVTQKRTADDEGFQGYKDTVSLRQSYPFSVIHDPSGQRGSAWLRPLISSAA